MWGKRIFGSVVACALASSAHATVLTFDTDVRTQAVVSLDQAYGDHVAAPLQGFASYGVGLEGFTPNVVVDYLIEGVASTAYSREHDFYGDLVNVIANNNGAGRPQLLFTADPGYQMVLYGFDLGGFPNTDRILQGVTVTSGATTLFSQSDVLIHGAPPAPQHTGFAFAGGLNGGQSLLLSLDLTGLAAHRFIGIDNVRFGQVAIPAPPGGVPEPAAWAMLVLGFATIGGLLRTRARRPAAA
jgi:hypothetical protein